MKFRALEDDPPNSTTITGTVFVDARWLMRRSLYDLEAFRHAKPKARTGNLIVYYGTFELPWLPAERRRIQAWHALANGRSDKAERLFTEVVALYPPDYGSSLELGNLRVGQGDITGAVDAYLTAKRSLSSRNSLRGALARQISVIQSADSGTPRPLRNPWLE